MCVSVSTNWISSRFHFSLSCINRLTGTWTITVHYVTNVFLVVIPLGFTEIVSELTYRSRSRKNLRLWSRYCI